MLYFPTVSVIRDPGYFNIWTDAFENIWNYFLRIEIQKWFKIFIFWWTLDSSMYCFPSWIHNVTGNVSESSFYCRNFWEIFHSGNGDSGWPDDCLSLVCAFQPPDFWSYVLLLRKSMKITRLPGSSPSPPRLSFFFLYFPSCSLRSTVCQSQDVVCHCLVSGEHWTIFLDCFLPLPPTAWQLCLGKPQVRKGWGRGCAESCWGWRHSPPLPSWFFRVATGLAEYDLRWE